MHRILHENNNVTKVETSMPVFFGITSQDNCYDQTRSRIFRLSVMSLPTFALVLSAKKHLNSAVQQGRCDTMDALCIHSLLPRVEKLGHKPKSSVGKSDTATLRMAFAPKKYPTIRNWPESSLKEYEQSQFLRMVPSRGWDVSELTRQARASPKHMEDSPVVP